MELSLAAEIVLRRSVYAVSGDFHAPQPCYRCHPWACHTRSGSDHRSRHEHGPCNRSPSLVHVTERKLAGAAKTSFMTKCEKDAAAACDAQAAERKLAGAARNSFTKKCVTDAVGT